MRFEIARASADYGSEKRLHRTYIHGRIEAIFFGREGGVKLILQTENSILLVDEYS